MRQRLFVGIILLIASFYAIAILAHADLMQDYAAAWARWEGRDPNSSTAALLAACCPSITSYPNIPQTAHPPAATLMILPFALLPWKVAQVLWLLISWCLIMWSWHVLDSPPSACMLTAIFWLVALSLGGLEPVIFALIAGAMLLGERRPQISGVLLGLAAAIKIYPGLLIIGLWLSGRRRNALAAGITVAVVAGLAELALGPGSTLGWLRYTPINTLAQLDSYRNLSLVHILYLAIPALSPAILALLSALGLIIPIRHKLPASDGVRPLVPVMLLSSPICWEQYLAFLVLNPLNRIQQLLLAMSGVIIFLVWLHFISGENLALIGYGPLIIVLLLAWYRERVHVRG